VAFSGIDAFSYQVSDGSALSEIVSAELTVVANQPPDTEADTYAVLTGTVLSVDAVEGVLANDSDAEQSLLTAFIVSLPTSGSVILSDDGAFEYTPNAGFTGDDTFSYSATDGDLVSLPVDVDIRVFPPEESEPVISFWYGDNQRFGDFGQPQSWINILGNVSDPDEVVSLTYSLNSAAAAPLSVGPAERRLAEIGDFNIDIPVSAAIDGINTVAVTAVDGLGITSAETISFNYDSQTVWPSNYQIDWASVTSIQDVAQIVDGNWITTADGVRSNTESYSRYLALGDMSWTDFEVESSFIVHAYNQEEFAGVGVIMRWQGHTDNPTSDRQPKAGYLPRGALGWMAFLPQGGQSRISVISADVPVARSNYNFDLGQRYNFRFRVRTIDGVSNYYSKVWADTDIEPEAWSLTLQATDSGLSAGSLVLVAEYADVTFGDVNVLSVTPPAANDDLYTFIPDTSLAIDATSGVLSNDIDSDGDNLIVTVLDDVSNGQLNLSDNGAFAYTPNAGFLGHDYFSYVVSDGVATTNGLVRLIADGVENLAPSAANDAYVVTETREYVSSVELGLQANDSDPESGLLSAILVSAPSHGVLQLAADGSFSYTSTAGFTGDDSFTYLVNDGLLDSAVATVTLTVTEEINVPPVANADTYSALFGNALEIDASAGVIANDTDTVGSNLTTVVVDLPQHGALTLETDGSFVYVPGLGYSGLDSFTYQLSDGEFVAGPVLVELTVQENQPPVAVADQFDLVSDTESSVANGVLANDSDVEGANLSVTLISDVSTGTLALDPLGTFVYTPAPGFIGETEFSYQLSDGYANSDVAIAVINVVPPEFFAPKIDVWYGDNQSFGAQGQAQTWVNIVGNVSDNNGIASLFYSLNGSPLRALAIGSDDKRLWDDGDFNADIDVADLVDGSNQVVITAVDIDGIQSSVTVTVNYSATTVWPENYNIDWSSVNDIQDTIQVVDGMWEVGDGGLKTVTTGYDRLVAIGDVTHTDYDIESQFTIHALDDSDYAGVGVITRWTGHTDDPISGYQPKSGWLPYGAIGWAAFITQDTAPRMQVGGYLLPKDRKDYNLILGQTYNFRYRTETVSDSESLYRLKVWQDGAQEPAEWDVSYSDVTTDVASGSALLVAYHADVTFGDVSVRRVVANNEPPTANPDTFSMLEGETLTVFAPGVIANDFDADGDPLQAILVDTPQHGNAVISGDGTLVYAPVGGYAGVDSLTYKLSDGLQESTTVTVTILVGNQAPVATADSYTVNAGAVLEHSAAFGVLANDLDLEGSDITAFLAQDVQNGSLDLQSDGSFTYTPQQGFVGLDSFSYLASDGESVSGEVQVEINVVDESLDTLVRLSFDDALLPATDSSGNGNAGLVSQGNPQFSTEARDDSAYSLRLSGDETTGDSLSVGNLDITNGQLTMAAWFKASSFTAFERDHRIISKSSGIAESDDFFSLGTVAAAGDATRLRVRMNVGGITRIIRGNSASNLDAGRWYHVAATYDGALIRLYRDGVEIGRLSASGDLRQDPTVPVSVGSVLGASNFFDGLLDDVRLMGRAMSEAEINAIVAKGQINQTPIVFDDAYSTPFETPMLVGALEGVIANDVDVDSDALTASLVTDVANGTLGFEPDGSFSYIPQAGFSGLDQFSYQVSDGSLVSVEAFVIITVDEAPNAPPVATADAYSTSFQSSLVIDQASGVLSNDLDAEGVPLVATLVSDVSHGVLAFDSSGSFSYNPDSGFNGADAFTYTATDGNLDSEVTLVTIEVGNQVPVTAADLYVVESGALLSVDVLNGVLANDLDSDGDILTISEETGVAHGLLTLNADGSFTYQSDTDFNGIDAFTYSVNDGTHQTVPVDVTIRVGNQAPVAVGDSYNVVYQQQLNIDADSGVIANDSDYENALLSAILVSDVSNGALALNPDGAFSYLPADGFSGQDQFSYIATDSGQNSAETTVILSVASPDPDLQLHYRFDDAAFPITDYSGKSNSGQVVGTPVFSTDTFDDSRNSLDLGFSGADGHAIDAGNLAISGDQLTLATWFKADSFPYVNRDSRLISQALSLAEEGEVFSLGFVGAASNSTRLRARINVNGNILALRGGSDSNLVAGRWYHAAVTYDGINLRLYLNGNEIASSLVSGTIALDTINSLTVGSLLGTDKFFDGRIDDVRVVTRALSSQEIAGVATVFKPPVAVADTYSVNTGSATTVPATSGVLSNDVDPDGGELTASLVSGPQFGVLSDDGSFTYLPESDSVNVDRFTYIADDGDFQSDETEVTLFVGNQAPVAVADFYQSGFGSYLRVFPGEGVLVNDIDLEGEPLTPELVTDVAFGTLFLSADGSLSYVPNTGFVGVDTFTYRVTDGDEYSEPVVVEILVNNEPVAFDDVYTAVEDTPLTVDATSGVIVNDVNPDGDTLSALLLSDVQFGDLEFNTDGSFLYTADGTSTLDSFTYQLTDGVFLSEPAEVRIIVGNQTPIAEDDVYAMTGLQPYTVGSGLGVLANDTDLESPGTLSAIIQTYPANGNLTFSIDGAFSYVANDGFRGVDGFTYIASDGLAASAEATVTLYVGNQQPVATTDNYSTEYLTGLVVAAPIGVLANDIDVDGNPLAAVLVSDVSNGVLALEDNGGFLYTPNSGFEGVDSFEYFATDGVESSASVVVTINVAVEDQDELLHYTFDDAGSLITDSSGKGNVGTVVGGDAQYEEDVPDNSFFSLRVGAENSADRSIESGIIDLGGTGMTLSAWFKAEAWPGLNRNSTLIAKAAVGSVDQEIFQLGTIAANTTTRLRVRATINGRVLSLRADPGAELDTNRWYHAAATYDGGTLRLYLDGDEVGSLTIPGTIDTDATAPVTVGGSGDSAGGPLIGLMDDVRILQRPLSATEVAQISDVNRPPVTIDDIYLVQENRGLARGAPGGVLANDYDPDGSPLSATLVSDITFGQRLRFNADGSFSYSPAADFNGTDTFTYRANDGLLSSRVTNVTIISGDQPPTATNDSYFTDGDTLLSVDTEQSVLVNDIDINQDPLSAELVSSTINGTLALREDGTFDYQPNPGFKGADFFAYRASDGNLNSAVVVVTIQVNDSAIGVSDTYATAIDNPLNVSAVNGVLANDTDAEGDGLEAILLENATNGFVTLNSDGSFSYVPADGFNDADSFSYLINDGVRTSAEPTIVDILVGDQAPTVVDDIYPILLGTTFSTDAVTGVLSNDSDFEGSSLSALLVDDVSHGTLTFNGDGSFLYTPNSENVIDQFTYVATDGDRVSRVATVSLVVGNQVPNTVEDTYELIVESPLEVLSEQGVLSNDSDADGQEITAELINDVQNGVLEFAADGSFVYSPSAGFFGQDGFSYRATDGQLYSPETNVVLNVADSMIPAPAVYNASVPTTYKEYWVDHEWFVGGDSCADPDNPPQGGQFYIELHGGINKACPLFFDIDDDLSNLPDNTRVELFMDIWRGRKDPAIRFNINDGPTYIPHVSEDWSRTPMVVKFPFSQLVAGTNKINLWRARAAYHVHDIAIRVYFDPSNPIIEAPRFEPVTLPSGNLTSVAADNGTQTNLANGGVLRIDSDEITLTANVATEAAFVEFHAYYDGYDEDVDGETLDWHSRTRNNYHPGGIRQQITGGTIDHIGTLRVIDSGDYSVTWNVSAIKAQRNVRFKIRVKDFHGNAVDAAGGVTGPFELARLSTTVDTFVIPDFTDEGIGLFGDEGLSVSKTISLPSDISVYDEAYILGSYWNNPFISINGATPFAAFADGSDTWQVKANQIPISDLVNGENIITYSYNDEDVGHFIEKPGPMIVLRSDSALAPVAVSDSYTVNFEQQLVVDAVTGLLANDVDIDGSSLTSVALVEQPTNGTVALNIDGSFVYTPDAGFSGLDTFSYTASNGVVQTDNAYVTIEVGPDPLADLIAQYDFDDNAAVATDSGNRGNNGLFNGGSYAQDTPDGSFASYQLDGLGESIDIAGIDVDGTGLTLSAWIKPSLFEETGETTRIISKSAGSSLQDQIFSIEAFPSGGQTLLLGRIRISGVSHTVVASSGALLLDSWQHIVLTYNKELARLFVNGVEVGSRGLTGDIEIDDNASVSVGSQGGVSNFYTGLIDGIRILQRPLEFTELQQIVSGVSLPITVSDAYTATEDNTLNVDTAGGILANEVSLNDGAITALLNEAPINGSVVLSADGAFTYTPAPDFSGTDFFTYRVNNGDHWSENTVVTIDIAGDNDNPVATEDSYQTAPDTTLTIAAPGLLNNDTDVDLDLLQVISTSVDTANGTVSIAADGSFTYTPDTGFTGLDTFSYIAVDTVGAQSSETTVSVNVVVPPVAAGDTYVVVEDGNLDVPANGVLGNDTDVNGAFDLIAQLVDAPANGSVVLNVDGSFSYQPNTDFSGVDSFVYQVEDADNGGVDSATVILNVTGQNDAPVAVADLYSAEFNTIVNGNVTDNDSDAESDSLIVTLIDQPVTGSLVLNDDGSFVYRPTLGFSGSASFTYSLSDGQLQSGVVTVVIEVDQVPPVDDTLLVQLQFDDGAASATDSSIYGNNGVYFSNPIYSTQSTDGSTSSIALDGIADGIDIGSFDVTGDQISISAWFKADVFAGSSRSSRLVSKAVGETPDAHIFMLSTSRSGSNTVLRARVRINGSTTTLVATDGNLQTGFWYHAAMVYNGATLTLYLDGVNVGSVPLSGNIDTDPDMSVMVGAQPNSVDNRFDGLLDDVRIIQGALTPAQLQDIVAGNEIPVAVSDSYTATEDATLVVNAVEGVLANDTDADQELLSALISALPANGSVTLSTDGSFVYTPLADFNGTDTFTYQASDGRGSSSATSVTINVTPINDAPVAVADFFHVETDAELQIAAPGVLQNDTDVEGDALEAQPRTVNTAHGSVQLFANGSFIYNPQSGYNGPDSFTYIATDGSLTTQETTVSLVIGPRPIAADDSYSLNEDSALSVIAPGLLSNDTDVSGPLDLLASLVVNAEHGNVVVSADGSFSYVPDARFSGEDSFVYRILDPITQGLAEATATLQVVGENDQPQASDDVFSTEYETSISATVLANDSDPDGDSLTALLLTGPDNGTLDLQSDGSFVYTPDTEFFGNDSFSYQVNDGELLSSAAFVSIIVEQLVPQDPDVLVYYPLDSVSEQATDISGYFNHGTLVGATYDNEVGDGSRSSLGFDGFNDRVDVGNIDVTGDALTLAAWVKAESFPGNARDPRIISKASSIATDDHVFMLGTYQSGTDGTVLRGRVRVAGSTTTVVADTGMLETDTWYHAALVYDGTTVSLYLNGSSVGAASLSGSVDVDPTMAVAVGAQPFAENHFDGLIDDVLIAQRAFSIVEVQELASANIVASALPDSYAVTEDQVLDVVENQGVLSNDTDADGDALVATLLQSTPYGSLIFSDNGSFNYTPPPNYFGDDTFSYTVDDGSRSTDPVLVTITVNAVNDEPVAVAEAYQTGPGVELVVDAPGVLSNDSDVEAEPLVAVLGSNDVENGALTLNSDGSFSYSPNNGFIGLETFSYRAVDSSGGESVETIVEVDVQPQPSVVDDSYTVIEDQQLVVAAPGLIGNDGDVFGADDLQAFLVEDSVNGFAVVNTDGSFTFQPSVNFAGETSFQYYAVDPVNGGQSLGNVAIVVQGQNDAPDAVFDTFATLIDLPLTGDIATNDTDPEGDPITVRIASLPNFGSLSLDPSGAFSYTPNTGFEGIDGFTYFANDGGSDSAETAVQISVLTHFPLGQDTVVRLPFNDSQVPATDVSGNDNNGVISGASYVSESGDGTLASLSFDGTDDTVSLGSVDVAGAGLTLAAWIKAESFPGASRDPRIISKASGSTGDEHVFMLGAIKRGSGTTLRARVRVGGSTTTLIATNQSLNIGDWYHTAAVYDGADLKLFLDGVEVASTPLSGIVDQDPAINVTVGSQPDGSSVFDGLIDDVLIAQRAISTIELQEIVSGNSLPVANGDFYELDEDTALVTTVDSGVLSNDVDLDGQQLTATLVSNVQHGALSFAADGAFSYTPTAHYFGADSFTYQLTDGIGLSIVAQVDLSVVSVNDLPVANDDLYQGEPDSTLSIPAFGVLENDTDVEIDILQASPGSVQASNGVVSLNSDGSFVFVPNAGFSGTDSFSYLVTDSNGGQSAEAQVVIKLVPPPTVVDDVYSVIEDTTLTTTSPGLLENDIDTTGVSDLVAEVVTQPLSGTVVVNADGSFSYSPNPDFFGVDMFTYRAADGETGGFGDAVVTFNVSNVNDTPRVFDDTFSVVLGSTLSANVLTNDEERDGDTMLATLVASAVNGTVELESDGRFTYVPNAGFEGGDSFTYRVSDGIVDSLVATVNINVLPIQPTDQDLIVHLLFDDGTDPATDNSGFGNSGALVGPDYVFDSGDTTGSALGMDGVDDYVDIGAVDVGADVISMATWFKADSLPSSTEIASLISKELGDGSADRLFSLELAEVDSVIRLVARIVINGTSVTATAPTTETITVGDWYHAAVTYDETVLRLYINGVEVVDLPVIGQVQTITGGLLTLGAKSGTSEFFDGSMDDFRLLQRVLTSTEIADIASGATTADPVPTQPAALNGFAVSENRVDLNWEPSSDNFGVIAYEVFRDSVFIASVTNTSFTDLSPNSTLHTYQIEAVDADGFRSTAATVDVPVLSSSTGVWWDTSWPYRVLLGVSSGEFPRTDATVEMPVDFNSLITASGGNGPFEPITLRCHQIDASGDLVITDVPCHSDGSTLLLQTSGSVDAGAGLYYHIYFDETGGAGVPDPNATALVQVDDNVMDEGQASFRIQTTSGEYFYHKLGGGFSSWHDVDGVDWLNYDDDITGALGTFRGMPNMVPPAFGGHFHPGATTSISTLVEDTPLKATIHSQTADGLWEGEWEIYPNRAVFTVLKIGSPYWLLFEGTPGGVLDAADSTVRSSGSDSELSAFDRWTGDLDADEWVYLTASESNRSVYVLHESDDQIVDSYRPASLSAGLMTVLGFGREGATSLLTSVPETFVFGFVESRLYGEARQLIESANKPLLSQISAPVSAP
jgi:VCBS repeat-containing protein